MTDPIASPPTAVDVVHELEDALRAFFARRVPAADVEDLLQDCYLRVMRGLSDVRDHERLASWVFQIARRLVVDHYRARKSVSNADVDELMDHTSESANEVSAVTLEVGRWLGPMIDQLPEKYAVTLRLSELEERPHKEIAAQLGMSISGVKSRVQRGRVLLREKLNACCQLQFDARGALVDYECRHAGDPDSCGNGACC